jgi:hypothetical protein
MEYIRISLNFNTIIFLEKLPGKFPGKNSFVYSSFGDLWGLLGTLVKSLGYLLFKSINLVGWLSIEVVFPSF